jgi:hypothetical protein
MKEKGKSIRYSVFRKRDGNNCNTYKISLLKAACKLCGWIRTRCVDVVTETASLPKEE